MWREVNNEKDLEIFADVLYSRNACYGKVEIDYLKNILKRNFDGHLFLYEDDDEYATIAFELNSERTEYVIFLISKKFKEGIIETRLKAEDSFKARGEKVYEFLSTREIKKAHYLASVTLLNSAPINYVQKGTMTTLMKQISEDSGLKVTIENDLFIVEIDGNR